MKVLLINGIPRHESNCSLALNEMKKIFEEAGVECIEVVVGNQKHQGMYSM